MATKLTAESVDHLALVFKNKDGKEWAPRNGEAVVLGVKGGAKDAPATERTKKSRILALVDKIKGWYTDGPVVGDVPDNIDNDGDSDADYNTIVALFTSMYYDMQSAIYISDDAARSGAVVALVDGFLRQLDAIRAGDDAADTGKAGARHSAADKASIAAIADAHVKLGKAVAAATKAHAAMADPLTSLGAVDAEDQADGGDDETTEDDSAKAAALAAKSAVDAVLGKKAADENPKGDYGDVEYADEGLQSDKKPRYPIDTKEHAKAAWSYINKSENADKYSAEDLAKVKAKIKAACEKFGVEISDDNSKAAPAEEIDMTQEQIDALVAKAATEAATKAAEAVKAELQPQIDAAQADAEKAKADKEAAEKASREAARSTSGAAAETPADETRKARKTEMLTRIKAALGNNPEPTRF